MTRMTHTHEGELVVFHLGMTIRKWWRPDLWMPVSAAMPRMMAELLGDPDSGLLGSTMLLGRRGPHLVQYWSSIDKLYAYASAPAQEHRPAWTRFNRLARKHPGAIALCGQDAGAGRSTTRRSEVTCGRCLAEIQRRLAEPRRPPPAR